MSTRDTDIFYDYVVDKDKIAKNIGNNIMKLCTAVEWSQAEFARKTSVSEPALSNYIKGERAPSVAYLANICALEVFKGKGLDLHIDDLINDSFDPQYVLQQKKGVTVETKKMLKRSDFIGCYLCYYFDQTKSGDEQAHKATRELRYGVLSVYDDINGVNGDVSAKAIAAFFKDEEKDSAFELKKKLEEIFSAEISINDRNDFIRQAYYNTSGIYDGDVEFSDHHTFINIGSSKYGDNALIVLYSPQKKTDTDFIGGIGSVASVAHGRQHMPVAQKIILSKYTLGCSPDVIAEHLNMASATITSTDESVELCAICKKLYDGASAATSFLDDNDKEAIVSNRLNQLIGNYVKKNLCCVGTVSEEEDRKVFALIKKYNGGLSK